MTTVAVAQPMDYAAGWRRARFPVVLAVLFISFAVVLAVLADAPPSRPLDPGDASPAGSRALAELLRARGVDVATIRTPDAVTPDDTTLFIPDPRGLSRAELRRGAAAPSDVVVVAPTDRELAALGLRVRTAGETSATPPPGCVFEPAAVAGDVTFRGVVYTGPGTACYPASGAAGLVVTQTDGHDIVVIGSAVTFANEALDDNGDAALTLGLLGRHSHLAWVLPRPPTAAARDGRQRGLFELLPDRVRWAGLQLLVAVVLLALWRVRRLGPVVVEPLPVVVPAAETVRGRARLLRAARARSSAAATLRTATLDRVRVAIGLAPDVPAGGVAHAVAERLGARPIDVLAVLDTRPVADDAALVRLAGDLDQLETAVRGT